MIEEKYLELIAADVRSKPAHVAAAIELLDGGATIPFIARYRKDAVGNLSETQLGAVQEYRNQFTGLMNRSKAILDNLVKQDKLTDELRAKIEACSDKTSLEDLYLPFKVKRGAKAMIAEEHGLAPLADFIMKQLPGLQNIDEFAEAFVKPERSVSSVEEALEGARHVLAERFTMESQARALMRDFMLKEGLLTSRATKNAEGANAKSRFQAFHDFSEPLNKIAAPRVLAILRGLKEGILRVDIAMDEVRMFNILLDRYLTDPNSIFGAHIRLALNEAYARHLRPSIEKEVLEIVKKRANDEVIRTCCETARSILLAPPAGQVAVMGVAPEQKTACRLSVIDGSGLFLESQKVAFRPGAAADEGHEGVQTADEVIPGIIQKHGVRAVVVGTGSGARDVAKSINEILGRARVRGVYVVLVSAGPASAYAASQAAREEFPDLDAPAREALSLARRLQDPLAELVKVEPRSMGLGQQQYDVNHKQLRDALSATIVSCVSRVGAELNKAPVDILRYVNGIQMGTAQNVAAKRKELDGFRSRAQLMDVDGIGPKVYEQCAGFLRVTGGDNPLDATGIHPEAYEIVEQMAQSIGVSVSDLIGNNENVAKVDFVAFQGAGRGLLTLADIRSELLKAGHDPRGTYRPPRFRDGIASVETLQEGVETEGVVTSVTDFGAFADVGVQHDGLIHLSELSTRFVKNPHDVVKVGDIVKVKIIKIDKDKETPRISLSIKATQPRPVRRRPVAEQRTEPKPDGMSRSPRTEETAAAERPRRSEEVRRTRDESCAGRTIDEREERPRARPPRTERRDRDRERVARDSGPSRPPRRPERSRDATRVHNFGDTSGQLNTQLADQLAALREKFKG